MALSWVLTILFAATGAWFLVRCARPAVNVVERITGGTHVVMGFAMIAMAWPWGMSVPTWLQVTVFGSATVWFAGLATVPHSAPEYRSLHHAFMAAAMAWMAGTMSLPWHSQVMIVFAGYFLFAAVPLLYKAALRWDAASHAAMSVGTGILLLGVM